MADMLLGDGDHQTQVGLAQAAAGVQAVAADLEQLLAALLRQGAVLHGSMASSSAAFSSSSSLDLVLPSSSRSSV